MNAHRFKTDADLKFLFQQQLDRFSRHKGKVNYCEFGGVMIRPKGAFTNRLTHLVFPDTILSIPEAGKALCDCTDNSEVQVRLLIHCQSKELMIGLSYQTRLDKTTFQLNNKMFPCTQVDLISDLWDYFSSQDKDTLIGTGGFEADMNLECWKEAIQKYPSKRICQYLLDGRLIDAEEFPFIINAAGIIGTKHSFNHMPGFTFQNLYHNEFTEGDGFFEIGSAHIHPEVTYTTLVKKLERKIGARAVQMTVSPNDVRQCRSSISGNNMILKQFSQEPKDTGESFMTIIGTNQEGSVIDIQHCDFGLIDDIDYMGRLNDRTLESIRSSAPDVGLIAEHYEFFNRPEFTSSQLGAEVGQHVGDPDFEGYV